MVLLAETPQSFGWFLSDRRDQANPMEWVFNVGFPPLYNSCLIGHDKHQVESPLLPGSVITRG